MKSDVEQKSKMPAQARGESSEQIAQTKKIGVESGDLQAAAGLTLSAAKPVVNAAAVAPKRARGKLRVAAILDAGAAVFAEKGYDGATMTEIAARADTAIGSLYRFFPTKGALADVLLANYKSLLLDGLDALILQASAGDVAPLTLATALIDLMLLLRTNRDGAMAALDGRGDTLALRVDIRDGMRQRLSALLMTAAHMPPARARTCAGMLQHLLKTASPLADEDERALPSDNTLIDEVRAITTLYLQHTFDEARK